MLSVRDVAARYGVGISTVWRWAKTDPAFPAPLQLTNGTTRWRRTELEVFEATRDRSIVKAESASTDILTGTRRTPSGGRKAR